MTIEWPEIRDKVQDIHPVLKKKLDSLEITLARALEAAKACDPAGVGLGLDACKMCVELRHDTDLLKSVGIITEDTCSTFKGWLEERSVDALHQVVQEFACCMGGKTEAAILSNLAQRASELDPWGQELLVKFAMEIRDIERKGGLLRSGQSPD